MIFGFDTAVAPPPAKAKEVLQALQGGFCGVYIGGPENGGSGWSSSLLQAYATAEIAWTLPIYVGRQTGGAFSDILSGVTGTADGADAINRMKDFRYSPGAYVALDIESLTGDAGGQSAVDYALAWCRTVRTGGYGPMVYGTNRFLLSLLNHPDAPSAVWVANWIGARGDINHIPGFPDSAWSGRRVWQFAGSSSIAGYAVDLDSASDTGILSRNPYAQTASKQNYADAAWIQELQKLLANIPVVSTTEKRAQIKIWLEKHPA